MDAKHTPGPWTQCDRVVVVCPPSHTYSTWIANVSVGGSGEAVQLANARLIASAPELLKDLQEAQSLVNFLIGHLKGRMGEAALDDMAMKADGWARTIARATGEQA